MVTTTARPSGSARSPAWLRQPTTCTARSLNSSGKTQNGAAWRWWCSGRAVVRLSSGLNKMIRPRTAASWCELSHGIIQNHPRASECARATGADDLGRPILVLALNTEYLGQIALVLFHGKGTPNVGCRAHTHPLWTCERVCRRRRSSQEKQRAGSRGCASTVVSDRDEQRRAAGARDLTDSHQGPVVTAGGAHRNIWAWKQWANTAIPRLGPGGADDPVSFDNGCGEKGFRFNRGWWSYRFRRRRAGGFCCGRILGLQLDIFGRSITCRAVRGLRDHCRSTEKTGNNQRAKQKESHATHSPAKPAQLGNRVVETRLRLRWR
jgi:hypothetical protein